MRPADMARAMGPVIREFTAKAVADATAPLLTRNAALEIRILELETHPAPVAVGPAGSIGQKGEAGIGIASLVITAEGRLVAHLTDGRSVDAGPVPRGMPGSDGAKGDTGEVGQAGERGAQGEPGLLGAQGERGADGAPGARGVQGVDGKDGAPGLNGKDGAAGLDGKDGAPGDRGLQGEKGIDGLAGRDGRDGAPGLSGMAGEKGLDGKDGKDGVNGKDGLDGLGFDDFDLVLDETRGWVLKLAQGERVKEWVLGIPFDAGVWTAGAIYPKGAGATWDGHFWVAQMPTSDQPGEGSTAWRLAVRRGKQGREGKQGKDGASGRDLTQMNPSTGQKW